MLQALRFLTLPHTEDSEATLREYRPEMHLKMLRLLPPLETQLLRFSY